MGVTLEQGEESSVIRLEGAIDINAAAELKKALLVEFALAGRLPGPVASALLQAGFEDLEAMMAAAAAGEVVRCPA